MSNPARVLASACLCMAAGCHSPHQSASLAPHGWSDEERVKYGVEAAEPVATHGEFERCVVAGTTGPAAVRIGLKTLQAGGSAADAAIATSLAQVVLSVGSWNSFAGIFMMLYYDASTGEIHSLNAGYNTVLDESDPRSIPGAGTPSGRATLVPGFMAGVDAAHARFGRLPFAALVEPSIDLAENGFGFTPTLAALVAQRDDVLRRREETWRIFTDSKGRPYRAGDRFRQPDLARTLRTVASEGADAMYRGPWAQRLVDAVRSEGGRMSIDDLRRYEPIWSAPLRAECFGTEVFAIGLPELGGVQLLEALNLYEAAGGASLGDPAKHANALFTLMQAARFGYLTTYLTPISGRADDPFAPGRRITDEYAARNATRFADDAWEAALTAELAAAAASTDVADPSRRANHSDSVIAVDSRGNVAVVVHSSNNDTWGSTGIFVDGVSVPDSSSFQQDRVAQTGPGRRLPNATNPAIAMKGGRPFLVSGCIGSGLSESALQQMVGVLALGIDPRSSLARPEFLPPVWESFSVSTAGRRPQQVLAGDYPAGLLDAVRRKGQPITERPQADAVAQFGFWIGVTIGRDGRGIEAAVSPRLLTAGAVEGE